MRLLAACGFAIGMLLLASPCLAQVAWICTYAGFSQDHRPVIGRYHIQGADLVEEKFGLHYRILQNTAYALVAASSIAEIEPNRTWPSIGSFVIMIGKRSLAFRFSAMNMHQPDAISDGNCING